MNIFVLEDCPVKAAEVQCDKHVVKMIVESGQMLSTAHRMLDGNLEVYINANGRKARRYNLSDWRQQVLYKAVHYHHPCTVWTMESSENYLWHYIHFVALCDEYTHRYGKVHMTDTKLRYVLQVIPKLGYGGAETGCYDLAHYLAEKDCSSYIVTSGGQLLKYTKKDKVKIFTDRQKEKYWLCG